MLKTNLTREKRLKYKICSKNNRGTKTKGIHLEKQKRNRNKSNHQN